MTNLPKFAELPALATGERHSWDVFGPNDDLGTLNLLSPRAVVAAGKLVQSGRVVNLDLPLDLPSPSLTGMREPYRHNITTDRVARDDSLDNFYLQCSSQWDGLAHVRYREFGFYGGTQEADLDAGRIGIDALARHGIIGRGVLADIGRHLSGNGYKPSRAFAVTPTLIAEVLKAQNVALASGDILLVRTGWMGWYLSLNQVEREDLAGTLGGREGTLESAGLAGTQEMAAWLWDNQIASVVADNPAVEMLPVDGNEFLHRRLIALLGMPIGELFDFEELGRDCEKDRRYEFLFVGAPLNLPRGVGSPANAYAIK
jgi:kynurenine formamidase